MGELNLDKIERVWGQEPEQQSNRVVCSIKQWEIMSHCALASQNEMKELDRTPRQRSQSAYSRCNRLHRHFVIV